MSVSNPWLNALQRSYNDIKQYLIDQLKLKIPELTDYSEGNIFIILLSLYAAIAEVLHYYIDNMGRETFFHTARRYSSLIKHARMLDYHIKTAIPSMVDVFISKQDGTPITSNLEIPVNSVFTSDNGMQFLSTKTVVWQSGTYGVSVPLAQKEYRNGDTGQGINFGTITSQDIIITLGDLGDNNYYVEGSMTLQVGSDTWELVETFAYSNPNSKHYKVEVDDTQAPYIVFGNGRFGSKPPLGATVVGSFYVTKGQDGNLPEGSISTSPTVVNNAVNGVVVTNPYRSTGGSNYENFDMLKDHVPLSIKTLGVAISKEDYEDVAKLSPGVDKAYVDYICGKFIDIYITPDGGGIAPRSLIDQTYQYVLRSKVITTNIRVLPTGISPIYIEAEVTGMKSFKSTDISNQIVNALMTAYSYSTSDIGRPIRLSDLYALIDNQSMVDYLNITNIYLKPWPTPVGQNNVNLNISYIKVDNVNQPLSYVVQYLDNNGYIMRLSRAESLQHLVDVAMNTLTTVIDGDNSFDITFGEAISGEYTLNSSWEMTILPNNMDQAGYNFVIPVFNSSDNIVLNINETV